MYLQLSENDVAVVKQCIDGKKTCINYMKQEYSEQDFIKMCKLVYLNSLQKV